MDVRHMDTVSMDTHDVRPGDIIWNQGHAFEVAEVWFETRPNDVEVFRYRAARCVSEPKPPTTYSDGAIYGHNADIRVTVVDRLKHRVDLAYDMPFGC